jgi:hypothetical protein
MAFTTPKTYSVGDVLLASDMNTYQRDNIAHLNDDIEDTIESVSTHFVSAAESTGSTSYTDLSTIGPTVPVTVRSTGILLVMFTGRGTGTGTTIYAAPAMSGSNTVAANDDRAMRITSEMVRVRVGVSELYTGLSAGTTTLTMKYKNGTASQNGEWAHRRLIVIPL